MSGEEIEERMMRQGGWVGRGGGREDGWEEEMDTELQKPRLMRSRLSTKDFIYC